MATQTHPLLKLMRIALCITLLSVWSEIQAGGWATAVLNHLPEFAVRDKPVKITFSIKQHGVHPLKELTVHILARNEATGEKQRFAVSELADGLYTSELRFSSPGFWDWEIKSIWPGPSAMPQIEVIESSTSPVHETTSYQLGAKLFVAKGCIQCHGNARISENVKSFQIAIDLTNYAASAQFLHLWLQSPKAVRPDSKMPAQNLSKDEIDALTAFLL